MKRFYNSGAWSRVRSRRLRYDGYVCIECKRYGRTTKASTVHHIYPVETHWHMRLDSKYLISLCNECHNKMHNRVTDELTNLGKELQRRVGSPTPPSLDTHTPMGIDRRV